MSTALNNVTKAWKEFNIIAFQTELDHVATELAERQESSELSRKRLIEQNKEFKKNSSQQTKKEAAALLKKFQNEIDDLTNRSKAAESAFLNVYKRIVEAPDPVPSLDFVQSLQLKASKVADLEMENGKLRETLTEYNKEFAEVKNQEVTIKQLRERVRELEDSVESRVSVKLAEKERELIKSYEEKNQLLSSSQADLEKRLAQSEHNAQALQSAYNSAQGELFELRSRVDDEQNAKNSEMELVLGDLEVANQKLNAAEREIMELHSQLSQLKSSSSMLATSSASDGLGDQSKVSSESEAGASMEEAFQRLANSSLEAELVAKETQIEQLVEENRRVNGTLSAVKASADIQRQRHEQEYCALQQQMEQIKQKLESQRDYVEIKRELDILKSVEFGYCGLNEDVGEGGDQNNMKEDGSSQPPQQPDLILSGGSSTATTSAVVTKQSLELLLLDKNKKLQNEATTLRNANSALQERVTSLESEVGTSRRTVEEQKSLIEQLEQDLLSVNSQFSKLRTEGDGAPNPSPPFSSIEPLSNNSAADFTTEQKLLAAAVQDKVQESEPENTLLSIVSSQRERFKARNLQLEAENVSYQQKISVLRSECDKLRTDNIQLYEKIKYLQSYHRNSTDHQNQGGSVGGDDGRSAAAVENRYRVEYENKLDPFTTFSQRERQRKYANLAAFEKVILKMGQLIFLNKRARIMAFVYALLLHALVFMVLYRFSLGATDIRDLSHDCQTQFASHMKEFHGNIQGAVEDPHGGLLPHSH